LVGFTNSAADRVIDATKLPVTSINKPKMSGETMSTDGAMFISTANLVVDRAARRGSAPHPSPAASLPQLVHRLEDSRTDHPSQDRGPWWPAINAFVLTGITNARTGMPSRTCSRRISAQSSPVITHPSSGGLLFQERHWPGLALTVVPAVSISRFLLPASGRRR